MRITIKPYPIIIWVNEIEIQPRGADDTTAHVEYSLLKNGPIVPEVVEKKILNVPIELLSTFITKDRDTINFILAQQAPAREFMGIALEPMMLEDLPVEENTEVA